MLAYPREHPRGRKQGNAMVKTGRLLRRLRCPTTRISPAPKLSHMREMT